MYDSNVMPYGSGDERNGLIDDDGVLHHSTSDTHTVSDQAAGLAARIHAVNCDEHRAAEMYRQHRAGIVGEPAYGDTPAVRRTGITDRQAAGWDSAPEASAHSDAFNGDDANRPTNGLGTYHESDASW